MRVLRDLESANCILDPELQSLIEQRIVMLSEDEPYDPDVHGYFIVIEDGDTLEAIDVQLGFPILSNRVNGARFPDPAFTPSFEILEELTGCYDMVFVFSDDGYGVEVFIPKSVLVDSDLLDLCRRYAIKVQEPSKP